MPESICDKACFILQKTRDGEELDPAHLYLLQEAVNGHLNELGKTEFEKLYKSVQEGYKKPWFHGIEHLTRGHQGYVYWKGQRVEHYSFGIGDWEREGKAATELARRCRLLEERGITPTFDTAVWNWKE